MKRSITTKTVTITTIALFSALLTLASYVRIPVSPVPLTLQAPTALTIGYCLGPIHGALSTLLYTIIGLLGVPVFASGGGPAYLLSPTFGYIIGFTISAIITGILARFNTTGSFLKVYCIMLIGLIGIYIPGVIWLYISLHWIATVPSSFGTLLKIGVGIPLAGNCITLIPFAYVSVRLRKILAR